MKRVYEGILQTGITNKVFTQEEIENWWKSLDEDAKAGDFFMSFQGVIAYGTNGRSIGYKSLLYCIRAGRDSARRLFVNLYF